MKTSNSTSLVRILAAITALTAAESTLSAALDYSKSWSTGNSYFGASVVLSATDRGSSETNYLLEGNVTGNGTVLKRNVNLLRGDGSISMDAQSNGRAQCHLVVFGKYSVVNTDTRFRAATSFNTTAITKQIVGGSFTFMAGPVPISVSGSVNVQGWGAGKAALLPNGKLDAQIAPAFKVAGYASAGVNLVIGSAGIQGNISLLQQEAAARVTLTPSANPYVTASFNRDWTDISGAIGLYAKIGWGWFSKTWKWDLATFSSATRSTVLASSSRTLTK